MHPEHNFYKPSGTTKSIHHHIVLPSTTCAAITAQFVICHLSEFWRHFVVEVVKLEKTQITTEQQE